MKIQISSDDVNILVYRYLIENGYTHTSYSFLNEASMNKNAFWGSHKDKIPPNALITFLQKAMLFIHIEFHTDADSGEEIKCDEPFSFFKNHECWYRDNKDADADESEHPNSSSRPSGNEATNFDYGRSFQSGSNAILGGNVDHISLVRSGLKPGVKAAIKKKRMRDGRVVTTEQDEECELSESATNGNLTEKEGGSGINTTTEAAVENAQISTAKSLEAAKSDDGGIIAAGLDTIVQISTTKDAYSRKRKLSRFIILLDSITGMSDSGALSFWNPAVPSVIAGNFFAESPRLYRVPKQSNAALSVRSYMKLPGPLISRNKANPSNVSRWMKDGTLVACGYDSGHVIFWTVEGIASFTLKETDSPIVLMAFSSTEKLLAAVSASGEIIGWQIDKGERKGALAASKTFLYLHEAGVVDLAWREDSLICSGGLDRKIILSDVETEENNFLDLEHDISAISWDSTNSFLAIVDNTPTIKVWRYLQAVEEPMIQLVGHKNTVINVHWMKREKKVDGGSPTLLSLSLDLRVLLWDVEGASILKSLALEEQPTVMSISPDVSLLAVGTTDFKVKIFQMEDFQLLGTYYDKAVISNIDWRSDGKAILYNIVNSRRAVVIDTVQELKFR